ncbi:MAG: hypothetical protein Q4C59_10225, partial [Lachnospiraceae bacterium]|nr:hypothetical protein [Lachnospiraceae bacterium]
SSSKHPALCFQSTLCPPAPPTLGHLMLRFQWLKAKNCLYQIVYPFYSAGSFIDKNLIELKSPGKVFFNVLVNQELNKGKIHSQCSKNGFLKVS